MTTLSCFLLSINEFLLQRSVIESMNSESSISRETLFPMHYCNSSHWRKKDWVLIADCLCGGCSTEACAAFDLSAFTFLRMKISSAELQSLTPFLSLKIIMFKQLATFSF